MKRWFTVTELMLAEAGTELANVAIDVTIDRRTLESCRVAIFVDHRKLARVRRRIHNRGVHRG